MNAAICAAIQGRAILRFFYGGGTPTVEPHCHGISRADNEVLRAWQTDGFSESGDPVGWKLSEVRQITDLNQAGTAFSSNRPGYSPNDKYMKSVHCRV